MSLPNKYSDLSAEDIIDELVSSAYVDGCTDEGCSSPETRDIQHELILRFKKLETENKNPRNNYSDLGWKS